MRRFRALATLLAILVSSALLPAASAHADVSLIVTKTVNPTSVAEPGDTVTYTITIQNPADLGPGNVEVTSILDDIYGDLSGITCSSDVDGPLSSIIGEVILGDLTETITCTFDALVTGDPGDEVTDIVTVDGFTRENNPASGSDDATVIITDIPSSIEVTKTASTSEVTEPGDTVTFTVTVENTSDVDEVTIESLVDDVFGDLNGQGTCAVPQTLAVGGSFSCTFAGAVSGNAGDVHTNTVTASGTDDDGNPVSDEGSASVDIVGAPQGGEGCTPGYWKQEHHFDSWSGYSPSDDYETVFGVNASFSKDLVGALEQGGGGEKALGRHAVAALLNAASSGVSYAFTEAEVIALVQNAYATGDFEGAKNILEAENEQGCPLN